MHFEWREIFLPLFWLNRMKQNWCPIIFLQPELGETQHNVATPTDEQWQNARPYKDIPGPRGLPYIGQLYNYKLAGNNNFFLSCELMFFNLG